MNSHAPRLAIPYVDISGLVQIWANECEQLIVYEHAADSKVKKTHCHLLMLGCRVKEEALKRMLYKELPQYKSLKGNALWSWVHEKWQKAQLGDSYNLAMITYYSKGTLRPKYVKNIPDNIVEEHRAKWVNPPSIDVQSSDKYNEWEAICKDFFKEDYINMTINIDLIRSWTMRWYWKRDGRLPNAGCYKRNAASLFLKLAERREELDSTSKPFSVALEEVKNLWY